jgi:hypothetical protein
VYASPVPTGRTVLLLGWPFVPLHLWRDLERGCGVVRIVELLADNVFVGSYDSQMPADWSTLAEGGVAIGTLGLAFYTSRLAKAANADVAAQWTPVLLAARGTEYTPVRRGQQYPPRPFWRDQAMGTIFFCVRNVGRGPALDAIWRVVDTDFSGPVESDPIAIAPNEVALLQIRDFPLDVLGGLEGQDLVVDYLDIIGHAHSTTLTVDSNGEATEQLYVRPERRISFLRLIPEGRKANEQ